MSEAVGLNQLLVCAIRVVPVVWQRFLHEGPQKGPHGSDDS
jgi:hypothetical protein